MRILLACSNGLSTSLVVSRMQEAAKAQGKDYKIWAVEQAKIKDELGNFDVVMIGPQVRYILKKVIKLVGDDIPVAVIDASAYGRVDGAAVLKQAEELLEGK